jgi:hypothetical protein
MRTVTDKAIKRVASDLNVDEPAVRAVIEVETSGAGFLEDGRPKILFERHIFSRRSGRLFDATHPHLSNRDPGGYAHGPNAEMRGRGEYMRLYEAMQLAPEAAIESASWGMAQCMGFNWALCGEKSLFGFLLAMHHSEDAHLFLFARFLKSTGLDDELRRHAWEPFARGYNGQNYRANDYHIKLPAAWRKHGGGIA